MKQKLVEQVLRNGVVDTNRFRYVLRDYRDRFEIHKINLEDGARKVAKIIRREDANA